MLFERWHITNRKRSLKQHVKYFNSRIKIQLDHPVVCKFLWNMVAQLNSGKIVIHQKKSGALPSRKKESLSHCIADQNLEEVIRYVSRVPLLGTILGRHGEILFIDTI